MPICCVVQWGPPYHLDVGDGIAVLCSRNRSIIQFEAHKAVLPVVLLIPHRPAVQQPLTPDSWYLDASRVSSCLHDTYCMVMHNPRKQPTQ